MAKPVSPEMQPNDTREAVGESEVAEGIDDEESETEDDTTQEESRKAEPQVRKGPGSEDQDKGQDTGGNDAGVDDRDMVCMPCGDDGVDDEGTSAEAQVQRIATGPIQPTAMEIEEHELNGHAQFRSWCRACVLGRARDAPSSRVRGLFAESVLPRVRMDYCFLTKERTNEEIEEGGGSSERTGSSITCAVMHESLCKSVWACALQSRGATERQIIDRVIEDSDTASFRNDRLVSKFNQEPSIVDVMKEHIALAEAKKLGIPVIAMVDTNSDPRPVDFPIPANDDASKSIKAVVDAITAAVKEGLAERGFEKEAPAAEAASAEEASDAAEAAAAEEAPAAAEEAPAAAEEAPAEEEKADDKEA